MKKGHKKLLIFQLVLIFLILLNSFISNILVKYNLIIFLILILVVFKYLFGYEKDRHRYTKDVMFEVFSVLSIGFILYYISGLILGFVRTSNYFTSYGLNTFLIPNFFAIILKEFLRYNMLKKAEGSKVLLSTTIALFLTIDLINFLSFSTFKSAYTTFMFIALHFLPSLSNNIVSAYICRKVGYKPNLMWLLVVKMYYYILPIVPNYSDYLISVVRIIFPIIIGYKVYNMFSKDRVKESVTNENKKNYLYIVPTAIFVAILVYFTSGYFKYQTYAIASGSMLPNIRVGDVVVVERTEEIKIKDVIAYKYNGSVIVHRVVDIQDLGNEIYYYTKGDANEEKDKYAIPKDTVIGVARLTIPYIGEPAVWLSKL